MEEATSANTERFALGERARCSSRTRKPALAICAPALIHLQHRAQFCEGPGENLVRDCAAVPGFGQQAGVGELLQVVGDCGLAQAGLRGELGDADGPAAVFGELGEEPQAGWVGEHFKKLSVTVGVCVGEQPGA